MPASTDLAARAPDAGRRGRAVGAARRAVSARDARLPARQLLRAHRKHDVHDVSSRAIARLRRRADRFPSVDPSRTAGCTCWMRAREPVPPGVAGEAYVGGDGLMLGYLDDPVSTRERLVPDPFTDAPGAWLYRTGDIVRRRQRRRARVPRPPRRSGQGPRLSRGAGRSGSGARSLSGGAPRRGRRRGRLDAGEAARRLRGAGVVRPA